MSKSSNWKIEVPNELICTDSYYLIRGKKYHRVTKINSIIDKPELRNWYAKLGKNEASKILKTRANFGSLLHKLIEVTLKNGEVSEENYDSNIIKSLDLFKNWIKKHKITVEALEQHLWSDKYSYAGTTDCIINFDGKRIIADWKTSKEIYPEYMLQLSAYIMSFEEQTGIKLDGALILKIRDGEIEEQYKTYDELKELFEVFLAALKIYVWKYGDK